MAMDGDFMGDQDMPQPPQDNNQVITCSSLGGWDGMGLGELIKLTLVFAGGCLV